MRNAPPEFTDPRLVAIYDAANAYLPGTQPDFYLALAAQLQAERVIDLGCGTGIITLELAANRHQVIGVDPSPRMLHVARNKPGAAMVEWIEGGAERLGTPEADLAIMAGHVAQFFLTDEDWRTALGHLRHALKPGGHLAFESRNPRATEWERWTASRRRTVVDPIHGPVECWTELVDASNGTVSAVVHRLLRTTGTELTSPITLRYRTEDDFTASLGEAGFSVESVFGNWDRMPPSPTAPELIFVARTV